MVATEEPAGSHPQDSGSPELAPGDFFVAIYSGAVLPERKQPQQLLLWSRFVAEYQDLYTPQQFEQVAQRLRAGKSWVVIGESPENQIYTLAKKD